MKQSNYITCPYCNTEQFDEIFDLIDVSGLEGDFKHACDNCDKVFTVEFELKPFVKCYK